MIEPCPVPVHHWWQWHPPIGVYIGVLAGVGVIVPWLFRPPEQMGRGEKALWTGVMFLLVLLEINTLYKDRDEHDAEQRHAECQQTERFNEIAKELEDSIKQSQKQFEETTGRLNTTVRQTMPRALFGAPTAVVADRRVVAGESFQFNVTAVNVGFDAARKAVIFSAMYIGKPDDISTEKDLKQKFDVDWANYLERLGKKRVILSEFLPASPSFKSFSSPVFDGQDVKDIDAGKKTIYHLSRIGYTDKLGNWYADFCWDWQVPLDRRAPGAVTHPCVTGTNYTHHPGRLTRPLQHP